MTTTKTENKYVINYTEIAPELPPVEKTWGTDGCTVEQEEEDCFLVTSDDYGTREYLEELHALLTRVLEDTAPPSVKTARRRVAKK